MKTNKLYYNQPYATSCETGWVKVSPGIIAVAQSVAYPEGGGQLSDVGVVSQKGIEIPFAGVHNSGGRTHNLPDFPQIMVEQEVRLTLSAEVPAEWDPACPIVIKINAQRRYQMCRSHTAGHLVWLALGRLLGMNLTRQVRGANVDETGGRFDLLIERADPEFLRQVEAVVAKYVKEDRPVSIVRHQDEPDCMWWVCDGEMIACGGTHVQSCGEVGAVALKRRNKGRGLERISWVLLDAPSPSGLARYAGVSAVANVPTRACDAKGT